MGTALQLQPLKPRPPSPISTTKPSPRYHFMAVHDRRYSQEIGGLGQAVITALKSNEPRAAKSKTKIKKPPPPPPPAAAKGKQEVEEQQQQRQLSGADVLMALERATAEKTKKKKEKRDTDAVPKSRNNSARENQGTPYCSNVRPLCVKPEWSGRLEELERRLQELAHS